MSVFAKKSKPRGYRCMFEEKQQGIKLKKHLNSEPSEMFGKYVLTRKKIMEYKIQDRIHKKKNNKIDQSAQNIGNVCPTRKTPEAYKSRTGKIQKKKNIKGSYCYKNTTKHAEEVDHLGEKEIIVCDDNVNVHLSIDEDTLNQQPTKETSEIRKMIELLSDPSMNPNCPGKYSFTALICGVQTKNQEIVSTLLAYQRVDVNLADINGYTPLIWAADQGSIDIVKLLLQRRDVDVNLKDKTGYTALMWAADMGHHKVVRKLVRHEKLDVNIQDHDGHTALIWAADKGHADIVRTLLGVKSLDVNIQSAEGYTALICAASQGYQDIVRDILNDEKVDVSLKDKDGFTALSAAASRGNNDIVTIVKQHMYPVQTMN